MDEILAGVDSKDCNVARRVGHQFKGSGEGYGFPEITRTGAAVELAASTPMRTKFEARSWRWPVTSTVWRLLSRRRVQPSEHSISLIWLMRVWAR